MISDDVVKVRKIIYSEKGFQHGILLPEFHGDIDQAFDHYSKLWFEDHLDKNGNLFDYIPEKDAEYIDEFTLKDHYHFFVGIPGTYAFEGITEEYTGYPGCELDVYGFEKMLNTDGKEITYMKEQL